MRMMFFEMTIRCYISIMKTQISYIKPANGCTDCTATMSWIPVLHIYPTPTPQSLYCFRTK